MCPEGGCKGAVQLIVRKPDLQPRELTRDDFVWLDETSQAEATMMDILPSPRAIGLPAHLAWHCSEEERKALAARYQAEARALAESGEWPRRTTTDRSFCVMGLLLRSHQDALDSGTKGSLDTTWSVSVCFPSGDNLIQDAHFHPLDKLSDVVKAADRKFRSMASAQEGNVSLLCSRDGRVLDARQSLLQAGVTDGGVLTAVIANDDAQLEIIASHFHNLIMRRSGCAGNPAQLLTHGFEFPSLRERVGAHGTHRFYAVPGMYGGFNTILVKQEHGWKLCTSSFCQVVEGSEQGHEITANGVQQLR